VVLKESVKRGERYRDIHQGRPSASGTEWIVEALFRGTDGVRYAVLVCASDLTQRKALAIDALSDGEGFQRVWRERRVENTHQVHQDQSELLRSRLLVGAYRGSVSASPPCGGHGRRRT
jgi:hypothetical protein